MSSRRSALVLLSAALILACNFPSIAGLAGSASSAEIPGSPEPATIAATATPSEAPTMPAPTATMPAPSATACRPQLSANSPVFVRAGPGTAWHDIGALEAGETAAIEGMNAGGTWWYVVFPKGSSEHGWVAGSATTATCVPESMAIIPAPPKPTAVVVVVTNVQVAVEPAEIVLGDCLDPIEPSVAKATIEVNGPIRLRWRFATTQDLGLPTHTLVFNQAGAKDVSEEFVPITIAGHYSVQLMIEGMDLSGMPAKTSYKISC